MSNGTKSKLVKVQKDGQDGLVSPVQLKGLEEYGWTVVDDGNSEKAPDVAGDRQPAADNEE